MRDWRQVVTVLVGVTLAAGACGHNKGVEPPGGSGGSTGSGGRGVATGGNDGTGGLGTGGRGGAGGATAGNGGTGMGAAGRAGTGGGSGADGSAGARVATDAGAADGPLPSCPDFIFPPACNEGTSCQLPPNPECRVCIGGSMLVTRGTVVRPVGSVCACQNGVYICPEGPLVPGWSSSSGDCLIEHDLTCAAAKDMFVDDHCTEPVPCLQ